MRFIKHLGTTTVILQELILLFLHHEITDSCFSTIAIIS